MSTLDRRSLLKLFGTGTVIAPVVDGITHEETRAVLLTPPSVEIVRAPRIIEAWNFVPGEYQCAMYLRNRLTGKVQRIDTTIHATDVRRGLVFRTLPDIQLREG